MRDREDDEIRRAVAQAVSYADALRRLGLRAAGGNHAMLKRHIARLEISTAHFDDSWRAPRRTAKPLEEVLVEHSSYHRGHLKTRLYEAGLKERCCELCGQGEIWRGEAMALILDHVNGVHDDHRLENLRIVCPNCNATLATHCGRRGSLPLEDAECHLCGRLFRPKARSQRFCSRTCGSRRPRVGEPQPGRRRVPRPPLAQLREEIASLGWSGTGRKYGVSDNAVRKWVRMAERYGDAPPA